MSAPLPVMCCERIVIIGFGCIAQGLMPLLQAAFPTVQTLLIEANWDHARYRLAMQFGAEPITACLTADNFVDVLSPYLAPKVFVLNLATNVASCAVLRLCRAKGAWYLDTGIEPWSYQSSSHDRHAPLCTNHALRDALLHEFATQGVTAPTALVAHGANPGFVSALVKRALLEMSNAAHLTINRPQTPVEWARLARDLGVALIQISEVDSQESPHPVNPSEFANTWSTEGFLSECLQQAELAWGSHETHVPHGAQRQGERGDSLVLASRGIETAVCSWSPSIGPFQAFLLTHNEAFSVADFLTLEDALGRYRPTVYYAYRPCPAALASIAWLKEHGAEKIKQHRLLKDELLRGQDELGVLLFSTYHGTFWYGSQLDLHKARCVAYNSATSLQVASSIIAGMHWVVRHPEVGLCESEALDERFLFEHTAALWEPLRFFTHARMPEIDTDLQFAHFLIS